MPPTTMAPTTVELAASEVASTDLDATNFDATDFAASDFAASEDAATEVAEPPTTELTVPPSTELAAPPTSEQTRPPTTVPTPARLNFQPGGVIRDFAFKRPEGWVALRTPEDILEQTELDPGLANDLSQKLSGDPDRMYLISKTEMATGNPTIVLAVVRPSVGHTAWDAMPLLTEQALNIDGFRQKGRGQQDFLGTRGWGMVLLDKGQRQRRLTETVVRDRWLVVVQTTAPRGSTQDVGALHQAIVEAAART